MISPQSIAIGAAAVGLVGKEAELFRFTVKHSFIMLFLICVITYMQAYVITWIVPKYKIVAEAVVSQATKGTSGIGYLLILFGALATIVLTVILLNRKKAKTG
jgi:lactate permease